MPSAEIERNRRRDAAQEWRRWYKTARWQKLRARVIKAARQTCAMCGVIEADSSKLHCDHIEPHRGDAKLFWSGPFQCLCQHCHNSTKQRQEKARR